VRAPNAANAHNGQFYRRCHDEKFFLAEEARFNKSASDEGRYIRARRAPKTHNQAYLIEFALYRTKVGGYLIGLGKRRNKKGSYLIWFLLDRTKIHLYRTSSDAYLFSFDKDETKIGRHRATSEKDIRRERRIQSDPTQK